MLQKGATQSGIINDLDHLLSVDAVQTFKPAPSVYAMVLETFSCTKEEVRFFSSNAWDIAGAGQFGLPTVWVNRNGGVPEELPQPPTYQINSLAEYTAVI
jgi:2-haloacid dehalogenase